MVLKSSSNVKSEPAPKAVSTQVQWLIDRKDGAPNFELRKFTIKPGGRIPKHYHPDIEHEQYVLKGNYTVGISDRTFSLKPGDVLFIPVGTTHWYKNTGKKDAEFLCIIPKVEKYNTVYLD